MPLCPTDRSRNALRVGEWKRERDGPRHERWPADCDQRRELRALTERRRGYLICLLVVSNF